ncbi:extracellular solute-binding protein [Paenibacillus psychroresistens]|uniref:Extracellular solute-binding protein n=1 Tax=Paenibacillus psychroresistens TaxID=1778678 RepID=A0A6B8RRQ2_9BACL|nr:extracellular solute-binding protein [Paenibacillus psychroresistens]QGQ98066.1 extracellular solute-binding protein [Paenibacillus psychroresistens]
MKLKKALLVTLSLVVLLSIVLAGCSTKKDETMESKAPAASNAPAGDVAVKGDFEIQYFVGGYGDAWWKETLKQFNAKYPDLKIKESAGPKINETMKPRWIQNDPPDLIFIDGAGALDVNQAVKDKQLMDLTDWYKSAKNVDGELISDLVIAQPLTYGDAKKNYAIPMVFGSWGTFYDQALFKEKGWEVPTDFDSFLAVSEKIKAAGVTPYVHAGIYTGYLTGGFLFPAMVSANGDSPSVLQDIQDMKEGVFSSAPVVAALKQLVTLRDKGFIDPASVAINHTDSQLLFMQHKDAFVPNGLWLAKEMEKDTPEGFDFGYIPSITQAKGGKYIANPYTTTLAVAEKAKNPEAAKAFIQFVYTKKAAVEWAESTGAILNVKAGAEVEASKAAGLTKNALKYFSSPDLVVLPAFANNADLNKELEAATLALSSDPKVTVEMWSERVEKAAVKARAAK